MAYGSNVLPSDAAHYQLTRASISSGVLIMQSGSSAKCSLSRTQLNMLAKSFKVMLVPEAYTDGYEPKVYVRIDVQTSEKHYNYTLFPVQTSSGAYSTEIQFDEEDYEQFTFEVIATEAISFILWELCPESVGEVEVVIDGVKQSLPKLLYDYNTTEIIVEQPEQIIGMINCYLIGNTDLQGHLLMNFTASERCTVHIRFFDSTMIELFSPIVHTVNEGYNTLEVPHAYLNKLMGSHSLYVTAQATNGRLTVPIRGILYTVDGGYLAERLLNPGMDVSDITIRQLSSELSPSEIWAIGVDSGRVIVKKRPYNLNEPNTSWDAMYVLGEGTTGAVEFDGSWVRRDGFAVHTLETNILPAIAFVDTDGTLWLHQQGVSDDPIEMAQNVTCVSMVRGYKSDNFPDHDQGLVLCWVQDGNVFYRQYAYFYGKYVWQPVEQLTDTGDIEFVQVHRLNDYRIGIVTQGKTENKWYITGRTYVSQAVPTEILRNSLYGLNKFISMTKQEEADISFGAYTNFEFNSQEPQSDFIITFRYPKSISLFRDTLEEWKEQMTVTIDSVSVDVDDYDLFIIGASLIIHLHEPTWGTIKVSWNKIAFLFYLDKDRFIINTQSSYSFTWLVWMLKVNIQPPDKVYADLTGSVRVDYIEVEKPKRSFVDTLNTSLAGTATFTYSPVPPTVYIGGDCSDCYNVAFNGAMTFKAELVGNQPI